MYTYVCMYVCMYVYIYIYTHQRVRQYGSIGKRGSTCLLPIMIPKKQGKGVQQGSGIPKHIFVKWTLYRGLIYIYIYICIHIYIYIHTVRERERERY